MIARVLGLAISALLFLSLFYISRFWPFRLWDRPGLFGWEALPPQGGLLGRWLRGSDAAPFELIIWAMGAFLVLTLVQAMWTRLARAV